MLKKIQKNLLNNLIFIKIFLVLLFIVSIIYINYDFISAYLAKDTTEFIGLLKEMAIKNKNNPSLFLNKYNAANTDEERLKLILTNKFYACVLENNEFIKTKTDLNFYCGHYIKF